MRRRLLIALTVFAALAVLAFAVPLSLTFATSRTQELVLGRSGDADRLATLADVAAADGDVRALAEEVGRYHELYDEPVLVVDARGAPTVNAAVDIDDAAIVAAVAAARRNQRPQPIDRLTPWGAPTMLVARPVGTGVQVNGAVVIEASTARARADIAKAWAVIAAGAVVAMAVFTLLALTLSRWVLRPLAALSHAVADLTATLPKPRTEVAAPSIARRHGGPPEMRAVAESFDAMALAVADSADAQRQLVADTAHAMRNPLAALTIRLDSLEPAIPAVATATFHRASAEVERLTALLDGLLSLAVAETPAAFEAARATGGTENHCDAVQVVADRIDAWYSAFESAGMQLGARVEPVVGDDAAGGVRVAGSKAAGGVGVAGNSAADGVRVGGNIGAGGVGGVGDDVAGGVGVAGNNAAGRVGVGGNIGAGGVGDDVAGGVDVAGDDAASRVRVAGNQAASRLPVVGDDVASRVPGAGTHATSSSRVVGYDGSTDLQVDRNGAEVVVPADVLAQILDVPLSNSCRYAGSGTHTTITVDTEPGWVTVTVRDDGAGVAPEEIDKLATRFYRGATAPAGGSGLGLPIAAALTQARGGTLTVEPVDPHGLAIRIRVPRVVER
ncbi:ATP-binding protein [Nocardia sp. NBC_01009]|uniref:ATP-binding protein n=1 Tax=Nocardia sp. NBC_01009 TaxID=2975996 RepID=UPI00386DCC0A|nr:sensor histidine kinase [Nocardia sp. NBC_01009]